MKLVIFNRWRVTGPVVKSRMGREGCGGRVRRSRPRNAGRRRIHPLHSPPGSRRVELRPMRPKELTLRGLILGILLTFVFTAANVYLGLRVGLTFASSIPAAVISMAILSAVKDSSIL